MMRFLGLLFLLTGLTVSYSMAQMPMNQQRFVDSLNRVLRQATSDSIKAKTNYLLMYYWLSRDTAKARQCLEEGRRLSKQYPYLEAVSYAQEAYLYYVTDMDRSEAAYRKADALLSRFKTREAYTVRSNIWSNCAVIQQRKDNERAYTEIILNKAIPLALQAGDTALVGSLYVGLGVTFMNTGQYDKAETYLKQAIELFDGRNTQLSRRVAAYNRLGETYMYLHKYEEAKAILDKTKILLLPYPESELYAGYYLVEGLYYQHLRQFGAAVASFDKGRALANGPNKAFIVQELLFFKVKALLANKKHRQAKEVLTALSKSEEVLAEDASRLELYSLMAENYAVTGQMSLAYDYQKRYSHLSDSMNASRIRKDINELELKYQHVEKQKEILTLKARNEQATLSAKNSRLFNWFLASVSIFLLIVVVFALLYYRNNKKLLVQKELNYRQQLKDMEQQQRLQFGQAVLQGEEQERRRMARDLHDGLGGMLAGVKINLSGQMEDTTSGNQKAELQKIIGQLDHSVTELRRIAHNMMPVNLLKFGLQTALKDLCESQMTEATHIGFQAYGIDDTMPEQIQINIYRIVQELLANAIRHARATHIILQCSQNGNTFLITQEDNGKGFDANAAGNQKGIGLSNIRNRVGFLKGKMEIESIINEGTIINIELYVGS